MTAELELCGEQLVLRADRSLFWPRLRTLVIADPHFGKTEAFRVAGIPVPGGTSEPLARLAAALTDTGAERLVVLGDFWHSRDGRATRVTSELTAWRRERAALSIDLVRGNHDRAGEPPDGWGKWFTELVDLPFIFTHFPEPNDAGYVLAGHLHPGVVLGRERLRLPCFWFGFRVGVLPAFGGFTGAMSVSPQGGDRVFVVAGTEVVRMS